MGKMDTVSLFVIPDVHLLSTDCAFEANWTQKLYPIQGTGNAYAYEAY